MWLHPAGAGETVDVIVEARNRDLWWCPSDGKAARIENGAKLRAEYLTGLSLRRRDALIADLLRIKSNLLRLDADARRSCHDEKGQHDDDAQAQASSHVPHHDAWQEAHDDVPHQEAHDDDAQEDAQDDVIQASCTARLLAQMHGLEAGLSHLFCRHAPVKKLPVESV